MACRTSLHCEDCHQRRNALCAAIRLRAASVWPLVPDFAVLAPGEAPTDVSLKGGRFGILHSGLLLRCGAETGMDVVSVGEPLGEAFRGNREMRVTAVVPSQVCWYDVHEVEAAALRDPRLHAALMQAASHAADLRRIFTRLRSTFAPVERLAGFLSICAHRLAERDRMGALRLSLQCRHEDIATLLALGGAQLDEARDELVRRGLLIVHEGGGLELPRLAQLEDLAGIDLPVPAMVDGLAPVQPHVAHLQRA
ncbi:Crp/Fnr family transcriptional regulator [Cereibacter azotoformans]|uniref:CRP-like cAMP-binding protein n=1 Tax=Cereibacter azotoformans TaxID=43057 RepID=A0A2T5KB55_9RHOB|nr:Crp/Fnr family transcriptional regulator [Cereibacter azotoformans]AXQ93862.1 Crp/Fnr family transcriptional regulator [Cereibacter sphaeroides]MBO4168332.1 Crp/Fnr family transcriptional regulator [Cereibacter azotoformans]PTR19647.1 CRP-like cAMP-binding protein [Cereibacter azotoformans]UIJ29377.1 Crp/Fnr family transcriptional regulator [Cereibacter azotoformans]ULB10087.1 Crp/Fnr family transcriptional regulator [Cereibacter azotoformans]